MVFLSDAASAAFPAYIVLCDTYETTKAWKTMVISYIALCPDCHGTSVMPSGLFPSFLLWLLDCWRFCSIRVRWMRSVSHAWRCDLPGFFLHVKVCWPSWSDGPVRVCSRAKDRWQHVHWLGLYGAKCRYEVPLHPGAWLCDMAPCTCWWAACILQR